MTEQVSDFRNAACRLVEVASEVRRDGNADEFMVRLATAMNRICGLVGEGDGIAYMRGKGRFLVISRMKTNAVEEGLFAKNNQADPL